VIVALSPVDPGYPPRLAALGGRARSIHVRGALALTAPVVAVVGARAATTSRMADAARLAGELTCAGAHVISGGALGIDGAAHRGALAARGTTTVVLGSGIDVWYPARHRPLFAEVLAAGGALVTEFPPGTPPRAAHFLQRNQVIAALADVIVVVEAAPRSGSLSTAASGRALGRIVTAFPGSPGCDRLLAAGAALGRDAGDVLAALAGSPRRLAAPVAHAISDPTAARVHAALAEGAVDVEGVVRCTGLPVRAVQRALAQLELDGLTVASAARPRARA
jgi:DNA processing protein